jgi:hypothetical protein
LVIATGCFHCNFWWSAFLLFSVKCHSMFRIPPSIICSDKFLPVELLCFKPFTSTRTLQELVQFFSGFLSKIILNLFSILTSPMRVVIFLTPPPFLYLWCVSVYGLSENAKKVSNCQIKIPNKNAVSVLYRTLSASAMKLRVKANRRTFREVAVV